MEPVSRSAFWNESAERLLSDLNVTPAGLTAADAAERLARFGRNLPRPHRQRGALRLLLHQFRSPIAALLIITAVLSVFLGEATDAAIILVILMGSGLLGFWQERRAAGAVEELSSLIRTKARVRRGGREDEIAIEEVVPGDIVILNAGDLIPADCRVLETKDLDVDEATLTGESFPVSKNTATVPADTPAAERACALFLGTHVVSGTATALVIRTGHETQYGALAETLEHRKPESEFERGVRRFGHLLLEITAALVLVVFATNVALDRPVLDVFMFSLALAVGLTPQLLPAIVSVTLAQGARRMAQHKVLVRRLIAIEDFGGMNVLCTDKTGTLTTGVIQVRAAVSADGQPSDEVRRLAWINAALQSGFDNPIDAALRADREFDNDGARKLDEVPYDFTRRRLSVLVEDARGTRTLIMKGATADVLAVCTSVRDAAGHLHVVDDWRGRISQRVSEFSAQGLRCISVAYRDMNGAVTASRGDERDMVFAGILTLADAPKPGIRETLARLAALGVRVTMVTGDNQLVAAAIAHEVGLNGDSVVTGAQMRTMSEHALRHRVMQANIFAEMDPNQKERIILALKGQGASVGYLGDGINDAAALHAADVGISVDSAVDVTKQAADIVLLQKDLDVLAQGIAEGRRAFANTLKYVSVTTSANFGNMFSMAVASLFTGFLPMLPKQILLLNLLSDLPAMAIATDRLDAELVAQPRRWDVRSIRDFMIVFGLVSSAIDFLTFGLLFILKVPVAQFRTAWFLESLLTEIFVLLVIRTRRPFFRSAPSRALLGASAGAATLSLILPYIPGAGVVGFAPLPLSLLSALLVLTVLLVVGSEAAKRLFIAQHPLGVRRNAPAH